MPAKSYNFERIFRTLIEHEVDFIVISGMCGVLHGAPINTSDVDIVPSRDPENLERLVSALATQDTYYREHNQTRLRPVAARMGGPGHHLLTTSSGDLDVRGCIAGDRDYSALLPHTVDIKLDSTTTIRMLDLKTLITTKRETGRQKDKLVIPILLRTLEETERLRDDPNPAE
jgi:hypothetical protein